MAGLYACIHRAGGMFIYSFSDIYSFRRSYLKNEIHHTASTAHIASIPIAKIEKEKIQDKF